MSAARLDVEALYRSYGHSVLRRARQILASDDEAAEVLQELFAGLVARPQQFDGRSALLGRVELHNIFGTGIGALWRLLVLTAGNQDD